MELLRRHLRRQPEKTLYRFLVDGEVTGPKVELTRAELDRKARAIGGELQSRNAAGERILLLYPAGLDFVAGFLGALYSDAIVAPAYPPDIARLNRSLPRLQAIAKDSQARFVLTTEELLRQSAALLRDLPELADLEWIATDNLDEGLAETWQEFLPDHDAVALLQYTSGSTGVPKGVAVTHRNLHHNMWLLQQACELTGSSDIVSWMPVAHDMGLIMHVLETTFLGSTCTLMSPRVFIQKPLRWLRAISHYRAETSGGPNFSFEVCVRKSTAEERQGLDLSSWQVAWNAAEPVRAATIERFLRTFEPYGFRPQAFCPLYGLAESTVFVSSGWRRDPSKIATVSESELALGRWLPVPAESAEAQQVVGCGHAWEDQEILVVDPESHEPCAPDLMGEVWVRSPSLANGYWERPAETAETFGARLASGEGPFLRTGDLAVLAADGELYIAGRLKDLIILDGLNHYPQDIEQTVTDSHANLRPGCCAAFSVDTGSEEQVVIMAEVDSQRGSTPAEPHEVVRTIRQAVAREHAIPLHAIALVAPRSIPKTNSGKIQRRACRELFASDDLEPVALEVFADGSASHRKVVVDAPELEVWLSARVARQSGLPVSSIDVRRPLERYGFGSRQMVELSGDLAAWLNRAISPTFFYENPSIASAIRALTSDDTGSGDLKAGDLRSRVSNLPSRADAIAILGYSCRLAGGIEHPSAFWDLLSQGAETTGEISTERWAAEVVEECDAHCRRGGFLQDVEGFDNNFFDIAEREAEQMEPQQRLLLEVAWQALEDAGLAGPALSQRRVGVFVGISPPALGKPEGGMGQLTAYSGTGSMPSIAAGRLAYFLGIKGPCIAVDTACSSSLVAVHLACQSLRAGECDVAIVAGVNVITSAQGSLALGRMGALAADGRCKAFSSEADGFGRGEGCGVLVLAGEVPQGARPRAAILGSAINHDGASNGLTAPNGKAQEEVILAALEQAEIAGADIDVVEAHGTGTILGDPIEVEALANTLGPGRSHEQPLRIGSVKSNIGHLEAAAGIAGLIKLVLALEHSELPASLHCSDLNPHVPWQELPIEVNATASAWLGSGRPRLAGISSFGFSGTNAHVIVADPPSIDDTTVKQPEVDRPLHLLPLSARTAAALEQLARRYRQILETGEGRPHDVCFSAANGRAHSEHRLVVIWESSSSLAGGLAEFVGSKSSAAVFTGKSRRRPKIAFLFTGQGAMRRGAGQALYASQPIFRKSIDRCQEIIGKRLDRSLTSILFAESDDAEVELLDQATSQPAQLALAVALTELWASWGVEPQAVLGHSLGELAAAWSAGVWSLEEVLHLVAERGRLMDAETCRGAMAAVRCSPAEIAGKLRLGVEIAAYNGPYQVVISGPTETVARSRDDLAQRGIESRRLAVDRAFHSALMEPILGAFEEIVGRIPSRTPQSLLVSNLTGEPVGEEVLDAGYWSRHARSPVRFDKGLARLRESGFETFVEIGAHPSLSALGGQSEDGASALWLPSMRRGRGSWDVLIESLAKLYVRGAEINWSGFDQPYARKFVPLPNYPFERKRFPWPPAAELPAGEQQPRAASLERHKTKAPAALTSAPTPGDDYESLVARQLETFHRIASDQLSAVRRLGAALPQNEESEDG